MPADSDFLHRHDGATLAYDRLAPTRAGVPGLVFLHGLMSDRTGTKAVALADHCRRQGYGFVRFDMFGHGASSGRFEDGTVSRWTEDAVAVLDELSSGPQVLIGSSMGGWVMLKTALARPERVEGLIGIAAAPDFTESIWEQLSPAERARLLSEGVVNVQSDYDTRPYPIARALIEDGRRNAVLAGPIAVTCPVRLLHGQRDSGVSWQTSLRLSEKLSAADVEVTLIKDGDHRLSRPEDLHRLCAVLDALMAQLCVAPVIA